MGGETAGIWGTVLDLSALCVGVMTLVYMLLNRFKHQRSRRRRRASGGFFKAPFDRTAGSRVVAHGTRSAAVAVNGSRSCPSPTLGDPVAAAFRSGGDTLCRRPANEASTTVDNPYHLVVELATQGMEQSVIARKTGIPKAEIDLILKLQGLQARSAGM